MIKLFPTVALAALLLAACTPPAPTQAPTAPPVEPTAVVVQAVEAQPVAGGPTLLRSDMSLRRVAPAGDGAIRLVQSPADGALYVLNAGTGLLKLDPAAGTLAPVASIAELAEDGAQPTGLAFGPDGTLYVVANKAKGTSTQAMISRGVPNGAAFTWSRLATTSTYPLSNTPFDHLFNGVAVSPDGAFVYVNSGSRTDHGEVQNNGFAFPEAREEPITSAIFRLPADGADLTLTNDEAALAPYFFADGVRNAYDLAFAPDGKLFAGDNGPDADFADELNWLQEGKHYGFPWRFGNEDNPQRDPAYDPAKDKRLQPDFTAVRTGAYANDPNFPPPPGPFADPVANLGPAAATYRDAAGAEVDAAAAGASAYTFTPHRSPLGLVFVDGAPMPADLQADGEVLSAMILSWGAAGGTLSDTGQDLLHMALTPDGDSYTATTTQLARGFKRPIDAVLDGNKLYILEFDPGGVIWEISFS